VHGKDTLDLTRRSPGGVDENNRGPEEEGRLDHDKNIC